MYLTVLYYSCDDNYLRCDMLAGNDTGVVFLFHGSQCQEPFSIYMLQSYYYTFVYDS